MSNVQRMTEEIRTSICNSVEKRMFKEDRAQVQADLRVLMLDTVFHQVGGKLNFDALKSLMKTCPNYVGFNNRCSFDFVVPAKNKNSREQHIQVCGEFDDPIPVPLRHSTERDPKLVARAVEIDARERDIADTIAAARRALRMTLLSFGTVKKLLAAMPELESDVPSWAKQEEPKAQLPAVDTKATVALLFKTGALPVQQKAA